jgi:DNA-binding response OmpR family regulator
VPCGTGIASLKLAMPVQWDVVADRTSNRRNAQDLEDRSNAASSWPLVFVVDDDPSTLALLSDVAEEAGWTARGFTRLRDFETELRARRPDLVIIDDDLPDGSGGDRARELRADRAMEGVPIIVCTAAHPMRQAEIGEWAPVLSKPFDLVEVERFLHAATGARGRMGDQAAG